MLLASFPEDSDRDDNREGRYANFFKVGHNAYEFIIDFGQVYENDRRQEKIHSRIVTSPAYAKRLMQVLQEAVVTYETQFGEIDYD